MSKKYKIYVEETHLYRHTLEILAEDKINVDKVLTKLEIEGTHHDDIRDILQGEGIKILSFTEDGSPDCVFEVPDMEEVE